MLYLFYYGLLLTETIIAISHTCGDQITMFINSGLHFEQIISNTTT